MTSREMGLLGNRKKSCIGVKFCLHLIIGFRIWELDLKPQAVSQKANKKRRFLQFINTQSDTLPKTQGC
ncbi:hypothetical protein K2173_008846 [Erythroxylum novogranatense]|uniref:Uncharacterized protein n=1 Tax=Erythroxylum novogranatense TaxID=1862640 RepID=A0AAV8UBX4_9ROSI|nr:hypothetical protein K2173_008846 [Erythroxylum novogranatense]